MHGTRIFISSSLLLLSMPMFANAASPEYFPLRVGNSWVYKVTQGRFATEPRTIEVEAPQLFRGQEYFRVSYFGQTVWLRAGEDGSLFSFDTVAGQEHPWLGLGLEEGATFPTGIDPCTTSGRIESRAAKITAPLGEFSNALRITYTGTCADAGITEDYFLPYVGLLRHVTTSIAGPVQYDLVYARSGATNVDVSQLGFTMALDSTTYKAGRTAQANVRLTLRSTLSEPVPLTFRSGQSYDIKIYNDRGEIVYVWSADKVFTQIIRMEKFGPGERNYAVPVPLSNLSAGRYLAEGYLKTEPRQFSATIGFEIAP